MSDFDTPIVTWACNTVDCFFKTHTQEEADAHYAETDHLWFHVSGHHPTTKGRGFGA